MIFSLSVGLLFTVIGLWFFGLPLREPWNEQMLAASVVFLILLFFRRDGWRRMLLADGLVLFLFFAFALLVYGFLLHDDTPVVIIFSYALAFAIAFSLPNHLSRSVISVVAILLVLILTLHAQWGIVQSILQHDLHLLYLGERTVSVEGIGVAKFALTPTQSDGVQKFLRSYGPHAHPNSLGGVLSIGLLVLVVLGNLGPPGVRVILSKRIVYLPIVFFLTLGIVLTFSRSAYLAAGLVLLIHTLFAARSRARLDARIGNVSRIYGLIFIIVLAVFSPLLWSRFTDKQDVALPERVSGYAWTIELLRENVPWYGIGTGNYRSFLAMHLEQSGRGYQPWQIDYVHSVPLLLAVELGVPLSVFVTITLVWYFSCRNRYWYWLMPILPLALFDHYIITQPAVLVLVLLALQLVRTLAIGYRAGDQARA